MADAVASLRARFALLLMLVVDDLDGTGVTAAAAAAAASDPVSDSVAVRRFLYGRLIRC